MKSSYYRPEESFDSEDEVIAPSTSFTDASSSNILQFPVGSNRFVNVTSAVSLKMGQPSLKQMPAPESQTGSVAHNEEMTSVSKDLLDARLEAIEARMDARVAGMSAKLDTALAEMRADREATAVRFAAVSKDVGDIKTEISATNSRIEKLDASFESRFKSVIGNVWGAAIATITVVGATLAIAISSFDSGRETSKNIAEATAQMKLLQTQLEAQAKAATTPSKQ